MKKLKSTHKYFVRLFFNKFDYTYKFTCIILLSEVVIWQQDTTVITYYNVLIWFSDVFCNFISKYLRTRWTVSHRGTTTYKFCNSGNVDKRGSSGKVCRRQKNTANFKCSTDQPLVTDSLEDMDIEEDGWLRTLLTVSQRHYI